MGLTETAASAEPTTNAAEDHDGAPQAAGVVKEDQWHLDHWHREAASRLRKRRNLNIFINPVRQCQIELAEA